MLQWLAGQRPVDGDIVDPDVTGYVEPPETPAPVFAVRAFRHAFFGTPQTTQKRHHRSHSNTEPQRPKLDGARPVRPTMTRPKSTGDARALAIEENMPLPSPTKGILMTPGTANGRRKTVSFGDSVVDNESKRPMAGSKSGLPNDFPGKFPSPWAPGDTKPEGPAQKTIDKSRSELTEKLQRVKEDSAKKRTAEPPAAARADVAGTTAVRDGCAPPQSFEQLRREYEEYRINTTREVKKLVTKQKAAKSYAKEMDEQCFNLRDQLRQEQQKIEKLEEQLTELQSELQDARQQEIPGKTALSHVTRPLQVPLQQQQLECDLAQAREEAILLRAEKGGLSNELAKLRAELEALKPTRPRPTRGFSRQDSNDIWTASMPPVAKPNESPAAATTSPRQDPNDIWTASAAKSLAHEEKPATPTKSTGRAVTSGTGATPLRTLSINTLAAESDKLLSTTNGRARRSWTRLSQAAPISDTTNTRSERPLDDMKRKDSYDLQQHSTRTQPPQGRSAQQAATATQADPALLSPLPPPPLSSLLDLPTEAPLVRPLAASPSTSPTEPVASATVTPSKQWRSLARAGAKSVSKPAVGQPQIAMDAAAATILGPPEEGKRLVSRSGREVSAEFQEATKAKYAARRAERNKTVAAA
ncbi:hypothetical protein K431DRAFT_296991 [Polychaeton citri CBS 116435]|uniref:Spindle pole body-associated protein cut12 domain-containing protein n=1 Tax=Polychaeton citri CBS 116435 TaxID=1314669 RepID=A0A9P4Q4L2_9PEZI|nr:hypothetical protein K431DRAFT_296991 [Polychaeton citri CBS 116435]